MAFRSFTLGIRDDGTEAADPDDFLRSHRILNEDGRWVDQSAVSSWSSCVDDLESIGAGRAGSATAGPGGGRSETDDREKPSPEDFAVFARLPQARKEGESR